MIKKVLKIDYSALIHLIYRPVMKRNKCVIF